MMDPRRLPRFLVPVPERDWPSSPPGAPRPFEVYCSREYLVQVFHESRDVYRISVCRTKRGPDGRWLDGITWDELQQIKREVGFGDHWAVEVFPADLDVVNVANMRHLWVLKEKPDFAWGRAR